jgi:putative (di)nucleoside polyphosphate hydrolase
VDIITTDDPEKWKNYWQFPQGGIEENENIETAIIREVKEETGMTSLKFLKLSEHTNTYIWNNSIRHLLNKNRKYKYKGQSQKVAYLLFEGSENEIKFRKGEEFVECKWVSPNELDKIVHKERLPLVKIAKGDLKEMQEIAILPPTFVL